MGILPEIPRGLEDVVVTSGARPRRRRDHAESREGWGGAAHPQPGEEDQAGGRGDPEAPPEAAAAGDEAGGRARAGGLAAGLPLAVAAAALRERHTGR